MDRGDSGGGVVLSVEGRDDELDAAVPVREHDEGDQNVKEAPVLRCITK